MRGEIHSIEPDGTVTVTGVSGSGPAILQKLQDRVGGWIETIPFFTEFEGRRAVAFCSEEGKLNGLPLNRKATELWLEQFKTDDVLVGTVAVVTGDEAFMRTL
jgi:hypothetical protein